MKNKFSTGWGDAQKGRPSDCTTGRASGLHIKLGCGKRRAGGLPFSAAHPALFYSQPDLLFVQPVGPPFCLLCSPSKVHVFHLETRPPSLPGPPALQLVLSHINTYRRAAQQGGPAGCRKTAGCT